MMPGMVDKSSGDWARPAGLSEATVAQRRIAAACETADRFGPVRVVAGADVSMKWRDSRGPVHAAIAPLRWPAREPMSPGAATCIPDIPYVPGYLGFREVPALAAAWETLAGRGVRMPDLVVVDGHGRAHPRRCGIATHLGVVLDVPTIGCAKTLLCGRIEGELGEEAGASAPLVDRGEQVGVALRTRSRCLPVYVSTGHRVAVDTAVEWITALCDGRRLPLPIRMAHDAANAVRRAAITDDAPQDGAA